MAGEFNPTTPFFGQNGEMLRLSVLLMAAVIATAPLGRAQHMNEKDSPCADVVVKSDLVQCLFKAGQAADAKLNTAYNDIRGKLDGTELKQLVATQRLWVRYRDSNCAAERELYGSGTGGPPTFLACIEAMTRARTKELAVTYAVRLK
jgi:uncharacterized protein YecT (DUF1311 family)